MFTNQQIQSLNNLELEVFRFITANLELIPKMKIRELANHVHVSTSTILRFCAKVDCEGYAELKLKVKLYLENKKTSLPEEDVEAMFIFLESIKTKAFQDSIEKAIDLVLQNNHILFLGNRSSGVLGNYGAIHFSQVGLYSHSIDDPYYPMLSQTIHDSVLIVLSRCENNDEILSQIQFYKSKHVPIIAITPTHETMIPKLSDVSIQYLSYIPYQITDTSLTSQVPVIFIIELLAKRIYNRIQNQ